MVSSLWFLPSLLVGLAAAVAFGLVWLEQWLGTQTVDRWPLVLDAESEGARSMLSTIANTTLTLASVTFSITIVALALAASTYTPRILRTFISDRGNQLVLGVFIATFVYALLILTTIRSGNLPFVPSLALTGAFVLMLASLGLFIYFIHHIASSIQASSVTDAIEHETRPVIDRLFPQQLARGMDDEEDDIVLPRGAGTPVPSAKSGYIQVVDAQGLLELMVRHDLRMKMEQRIGQFVAEGSLLATIMADGGVDEEVLRRVRGLYVIGKQRTLQQDVEFGVRQLVDVALKALSPGINDPTTAATCLDHLGALLRRLAGRQIPSSYRYDDEGNLRVIARGATFAGMLDLAFDQIRSAGETYPVILIRILDIIEDLASFVEAPKRRRVLLEHAKRVGEAADRAIVSGSGREAVNEHLRRVGALLWDVGEVQTVPVDRRA